jgi:hypothetical protein
MRLMQQGAPQCSEVTIRVDLLRTRLLSHLLQPCKDTGWEEERTAHLARLFEAEAELLHEEAQEKLRAGKDHQSASEWTADMLATVQASHGLS